MAWDILCHRTDKAPIVVGHGIARLGEILQCFFISFVVDGGLFVVIIIGAS